MPSTPFHSTDWAQYFLQDDGSVLVTSTSTPRANPTVSNQREEVARPAPVRDALGRFAPVASVASSPEVTPNAAHVITKTGIKGWFQRLDSTAL